MDLDQAIAMLIEMLRTGNAGDYGYDLFPQKGARRAAEQAFPQQHQTHERELRARELSPLFYEAAWELCRRGIVRPGVRQSNEQSVPEGGYSLTVAGRAALQNLDPATVLLAQPGSLAGAFAGYRARFGEGFHQRSLEAIKCRNAEAWLACCSMAGAAAESILLAVAVAKTGNEEEVLGLYRRANGRQNVLNAVVGQAAGNLRTTLSTFAGIISLWRDEASHGQASPLGTANADEALRTLLHMCQWVNQQWDALTA
jgi:hypothetical protein